MFQILSAPLSTVRQWDGPVRLRSLLRQTDKQQLVLALALYIAFLPLVGLVPYWFATDSSAASAASVLGYNNQIAHVLVVGLACLGVGVFALLERHKATMVEVEIPAGPSSAAITRSPRAHRIAEVTIVFLGCLALFFPWFLSKYGPFLEDTYFLTVLHRMQGGLQPYVGFESLYGPLMLYSAHLWITLTGYSSVSYYALLALAEATQFAILLVVLQRYFPTQRVRIGVFVLLSVFLFNPLLGLSWNGLRRLLPVYILILVATHPRSRWTVLIASVLLGVLFAYSHEFGAMTLLCVLAIYGLMIVRRQGLVNLAPAAVIASASLVIWFLITSLLLGDDFSAYIRSALYAASRFSVEASFPFRWTVNSLFVFALLCLTIVVVGRGLGKRGLVQLSSGDYLLFAGLVYALIGLKSGLNRADMWHLAVPMLVLIFAFVFPLPRTLFTYSRNTGRLAMVLIIVVAATYFAGLAPSGSFYGMGLLQGLKDSVSPASANVLELGEVVTRAPSIEIERSHPNPDILALGAYLAQPAQIDRPVVLYNRLWALDKRIGVYKSAYPTDDFLLSDESGHEVRAFLQENPYALVVLDLAEYDKLFGLSGLTDYAESNRIYPATPTKRILGWLSSIHFTAAEIERVEKDKRWERTVGGYLAAEYSKIAGFGDFVVLARKDIS